ncbi:MAG: hypothetical protein JW829_11355, partial [Pirellulales bacterium]|nr:hypothetical protein [Pirellulales bacterium]
GNTMESRIMVPFTDTHVHLLAGLDDGPKTDDVAIQMCRIMVEEGVRFACATAHQNEQWPDVTCDRIRHATRRLGDQLAEQKIPLSVYPTAEVTARADVVKLHAAGHLLSVADRGQYLLIEMPIDMYIDLVPMACELASLGIRIIVAHAERTPELLHVSGLVESLIERNCLIQVSSEAILGHMLSRDHRRLKEWFQRGVVHLVASDGHSLGSRPPFMLEAYQQIQQWTDEMTADRLCGLNGLAIIQGRQVVAPKPADRKRRWWF